MPLPRYVSSTFFLKKRGGFENKGEMKSFYHQKWRIYNSFHSENFFNDCGCGDNLS